MNSKAFTQKDQQVFAKISGDCNPMHLDSVAARRMLFGKPVVHGIHLLLWGLDNVLISCKDKFDIVSIKVSFNKPIGLEVDVIINHDWVSQTKLILNISSDNIIKTSIEVDWRYSKSHENENDNIKCPTLRSPKSLKIEDIKNKTGFIDLCFDKKETNELFPNLIRCLNIKQIASLLAVTRLVGTECPGLNSIFSGFNLSFSEPYSSNNLSYQVIDFDERVNLVSIQVKSSMLSGMIKAFYRPEPYYQEDYIHLKRLVKDNEFTGQNALIIGGSRGLGEVACKLLVAGCANVVATYHQGKIDADRIARDINLNGKSISFIQYDVLDSEKSIFIEKASKYRFTHLYYFVTPYIFSGDNGFFSERVFESFIKFYVIEFFKIVDCLVDFGLKKILYPSTTAIDEVPLNMGEYMTAKSAGELVCKFLEKKYPSLEISKPRISRMATDQTVNIFPVNNVHPSNVVLDLIRKIN